MNPEQPMRTAIVVRRAPPGRHGRPPDGAGRLRQAAPAIGTIATLASGGCAPLVLEQRVHDLAGPLALGLLAVEEVRLATHPEPLHDTHRRVVACVGTRDDP